MQFSLFKLAKLTFTVLGSIVLYFQGSEENVTFLAEKFETISDISQVQSFPYKVDTSITINCGYQCLLKGKFCIGFGYNKTEKLTAATPCILIVKPDNSTSNDAVNVDVLNIIKGYSGKKSSCRNIKESVDGAVPSGTYRIFPTPSSSALDVYCDMETAGKSAHVVKTGLPPCVPIPDSLGVSAIW